MTAVIIDKLIDICDSLPGDIDVHYQAVSPAFIFSNSGKRGGGKKYFTLTLIELVQTLEDFKANLGDYMHAGDYVEATYRNLFERTITAPTVKALSKVQTMPLYVLLNKLIVVANGSIEEFDEKSMTLSQLYIDKAIAYFISQLPDDKAYLAGLSAANPVENSTEGKAENIIYYGAPGSGKSYKIDKVCNENNSRRITFHPDTQHSDFVGCLKPSMDGNSVIYSFRSGPFTEAVIEAHRNNEGHYYLVIEEINRAAAAAVFGEIFQLLDRMPSGESVYSIDLTDVDMVDYLHQQAPSLLVNGKLRIPSNLSILATMNSSDQAVMPMDTAFKRRWRFEYVPIDFSESPRGCLSIPVKARGALLSIEWSDFAKVINDTLEEHQIPEDRLLGPWFLSQDELSDEVAAFNSLKGKLLLYLWDDVLRHGESIVLFKSDILGFGRLAKRLSDGEPIFNEVVEAEFVKLQRPVEVTVEGVNLDDNEPEHNAPSP